MADSMALPTWSAQLASNRPLRCNSCRPSEVWELISMRSASIYGFAAAQQFRRDDDAVQGRGGGVETVGQLFDQLERDARRRLAAQDAGRDFSRGHSTVEKIARHGHERAGLCLAGRKAHQRQPRALRSLCDTGEARARQDVINLADGVHVAPAQSQSRIGDLAPAADADDFDLETDPRGGLE